jgi:endoglycosylceramidase
MIMKGFLTSILGMTSVLAAPEKIVINSELGSAQFRDEFGRARIFHGTNVVVKLPPYLPKDDEFDPIYSIVEKDLQYMKAWGVKMVRLGVLWEAVETAPGVWNEDYLNKMDTLINRFAEYDIVTMLDNH